MTIPDISEEEKKSTEARGCQENESAASPETAALGAAMLGPGWEMGPTGNPGRADSRLLRLRRPRSPLVARLGTKAGRGGANSYARRRGHAPPLLPRPPLPGSAPA